MTTTIYAASIDALAGHEGQEVELRFGGSRELGNPPYFEQVQFLRIEGSGEDRRAVFRSRTSRGAAVESFDWEAYRFEGRWVYGTSAEPLRVVALESGEERTA